MNLTQSVRIPVNIWVDRFEKKLSEFEPEARLIALYLFTSPHVNRLGIYYLPYSYIAHDTGLSLTAVKHSMEELISHGVCEYDTHFHYVWICGFVGQQVHFPITDSHFKKHLDALFSGLPALSFLERFCQWHPIFYTFPSAQERLLYPNKLGCNRSCTEPNGNA